jgi:hypothetical protein
MLDKIIATLLLATAGLIIVQIGIPDGIIVVVAIGALSTGLAILFQRFTGQQQFITRLFLLGLAARLLFGVFIHSLSLREFFGGDANIYDHHGSQWVDVWLGLAAPSQELLYYNNPASGAGWGMNYLVAGIYWTFGKNIFLAQSFCGMIGAATAPMVFFCARMIYNNLRVAQISSLAIALSPAFVIWSGQLLKDGLLVFCLVTTMTMVIRLQKKFDYGALAILIFALFGIMSLRFYIFYMVLVAVVGSFIVGVSNTAKSLLARLFIIIIIGVGLTYFGPGQRASVEITNFANLERIQSSRSDLASVGSGFSEDADVSTFEGAMYHLPIGFAYLMFAPFPWQAVNLRQAITIPEVILWWAMIPLIISGLLYTIKNRLRNAFPILLFSLLLTIAYSIFQGNVGTAYRQRTQIQVFLYIFVGVGVTVYQERKENARIARGARRRQIDNQLRGGRPVLNKS